MSASTTTTFLLLFIIIIIINVHSSLAIITTTTIDNDSFSSLPVCNMTDASLAYASGRWIDVPTPRWHECLYVQDRKLDFQQNLNCHRRGSDPRSMRWQPHTCRLEQFDAVQFFRSIDSHQLAIVGDSISTQHFINLQCSLEAARTLDKIDKFHNRAIPIRDPDVNPALASLHHLTELIWHHTSFLYVLESNGRLNYSAPEHWFNYGNGAKHIFVINTGAWFNAFKIDSLHITQVHRSKADDWFRETILHVVNNTLVNFRGILIFRSISPAHVDCDGVTSRDFQWDQFHARNEFVRSVLRGRERMYFLDIEELSMQRGDGHPGSALAGASRDCFHWCNPGPTSVLNTWSDALYTLLLQLRETNVL
jgi:hypothetical protein